MDQRHFFIRLSPAKIFFGANLIFIVIIFILGFRPGAFRPALGPDDIASHIGQSISFSGRVCAEADVDYKSRRLTLCANGKTLITTDLYPPYDYGDFIKVSGELQAPPSIDGFDYESYLARYDIHSVMYAPKVYPATGELNIWQKSYRILIEFKQYLKSSLNAHLPEPEAGLANALLLGYRRTAARADLDMFARVGLSHMIAISGAHITILSALVINIFLAFGFSRRRALWLVLAALILYPLITGLSAAAVRAAIMGGLACLAIYSGRPSSMIRALVFAAALMLAFNPLLLRDDVGFQLSFPSLLGIIYIYPLGAGWTERFLARRHIQMGWQKLLQSLSDSVNMTMVSQITILPVELVTFKQLSIIAPLANVLIFWALAPLIASLIAGLFLTALIPSLGVWCFLPSYLLLKLLFVVSRILAAPAWAAVAVNNFNWYYGAGYYAVLVILVAVLRKRLSILKI